MGSYLATYRALSAASPKASHELWRPASAHVLVGAPSVTTSQPQRAPTGASGVCRAPKSVQSIQISSETIGIERRAQREQSSSSSGSLHTRPVGFCGLHSSTSRTRSSSSLCSNEVPGPSIRYASSSPRWSEWQTRRRPQPLTAACSGA